MPNVPWCHECDTIDSLCSCCESSDMSDFNVTTDVRFSDLPQHDTWQCGRLVWNNLISLVLDGACPLKLESALDENLDPREARLFHIGKHVATLWPWNPRGQRLVQVRHDEGEGKEPK